MRRAALAAAAGAAMNQRGTEGDHTSSPLQPGENSLSDSRILWKLIHKSIEKRLIFSIESKEREL